MNGTLSEQQQAVIEDIIAGRNVFVTGPGGTGKSYLLNHLREWMRGKGKMEVCGSTGIAAVNVGGSTLHSWAGIGLGKGSATQLAMSIRNNQPACLRVRSVELLALDEVSMIEAALIDKLDEAFRIVREDERPFGGIQMLMLGDFCLQKGTQIIMADGSLRKIEDVSVGEQVMGPDSSPRRVTRRFEGRAPLFRVKQTNGDDYVVTGNHQVCLKRVPPVPNYPWVRYPKLPDHTTVTASDLAQTSEKFRRCFVGYKANPLSLPKRSVEIEPYFLGIWLGDGESDNTRICSPEPEIMDYCKNYAERLGLNYSKRLEREGCPAFRISITSGRENRNPLRTSLKRYEVFQNKHIPDDFLLGDAGDRLELLAGLLDTDGCWSGNRYSFCSAIYVLASQFKQLADGLGFRTNLSKIKGVEAWTVTVGGDTWRIPCRVERKKSPPRNLMRSRTTSMLSVSEIGEGDFAGIEVDGDHLFLLADTTVTHNCQLRPVEGQYAFKAKAWKAADIKVHVLSKVFRHADPAFAEALMQMRTGTMTPESKALFNARHKAKVGTPEAPPVYLTTHNHKAEKINSDHLAKLPNELVVLRGRDTGTESGRKLLQKCKVPEVLELKVGARVICCSNYDPSMGVMNGSAGTVTGFQREADGLHPVVMFDCCGGYALCMNKVRKEITQDGKVIACREQFPLRLGWAITVHSSQGLTLDTVEAHLGDAFERGQIYVALSRVRTLEGLSIMSLNKELLKPCPVAMEFYENHRPAMTFEEWIS